MGMRGGSCLSDIPPRYIRHEEMVNNCSARYERKKKNTRFTMHFPLTSGPLTENTDFGRATRLPQRLEETDQKQDVTQIARNAESPHGIAMTFRTCWGCDHTSSSAVKTTFYHPSTKKRTAQRQCLVKMCALLFRTPLGTNTLCALMQTKRLCPIITHIILSSLSGNSKKHHIPLCSSNGYELC